MPENFAGGVTGSPHTEAETQPTEPEPDYGKCPHCGFPLGVIKGFWRPFETPHCMMCLLTTHEPR